MATSATSTSAPLPSAWREAGSYADPYADSQREARTVRTWRRLAITGGATSVVLGLLLLLWPGRTVPVAAAVLGVWLLVAGLICLVEAVVAGEVSSGSRALSAVAGLLYLIVGIMCLRDLLVSLELLAIVVGIAWIAGGISEVISAITGQRGGWARLGAVAAGAIGVLTGLVLAFWPGISLTTLVWIAGSGLLALGMVQAMLAIRASRHTPVPA